MVLRFSQYCRGSCENVVSYNHCSRLVGHFCTGHTVNCQSWSHGTKWMMLCFLDGFNIVPLVTLMTCQLFNSAQLIHITECLDNEMNVVFCWGRHESIRFLSKSCMHSTWTLLHRSQHKQWMTSGTWCYRKALHAAREYQSLTWVTHF